MADTILIVDDDRKVREGLGYLLTGANFEVQLVGNGQQAIERYQECRPRLVFLDAAMPGVNGFDVCDFIRHSEHGAQTTIVFVSGAAVPSIDFTKRCANLSGGDQFISKPYEPKALLDLARKVMST